MIFLDTHIVLMLARREEDALSKKAQVSIQRDDDLRISPMVLLELGYMHEIRRVKTLPEDILADLSVQIGLRLCPSDFGDVAIQALQETWTRDPFDRVIVAQARLNRATLITNDGNIQANYAKAHA